MAFPGARGHFNYANLFFAKCFSLANSQKFDSRINNRLYVTHRECAREVDVVLVVNFISGSPPAQLHIVSGFEYVKPRVFHSVPVGESHPSQL